MPDPSLERLREVVCAAARRPPEERRATAERLCAGDSELLAAVLDLLELDDGRLQRIEALASGEVDEWVEEWRADDGRTIEVDRFTIEEEIGRGGSSIVYRAVQTEPVRREVALKVLRGRRRDGASRDRFVAEQQVLAMLEHPNVARVFDAGTTDEGMPWFTMELVRGPDLVSACRDGDLTWRERIDLVMQACWGVDHAHRKGILHRDIKPSNLLVARTHPQRTVKVIDFGIARPLEEVAAPQLTLAGHMIGTPQYMSPEQARDDRARVDVRSDVFALGVVLHEALTGTLPYDVDTTSTLAVLGAVAQGDIQIVEEGGLPGDLRAILVRSMQVDPELRYATPADLARDLKRYVDGHPVEARPAGRVYRTRKFVGRHPFGATAAALFVLTLVGATITSTVLYREATRATARAEMKAETVGTLSDYLQEMFRAAGPSTGDRSVTLPEVLDEAIERARTQLDTDPLVKAEVLRALGGLEADLGDLPGSHRILTEAVRLLEDMEQPTEDSRHLTLELYVRILGLASEFQPFPVVLREANDILDRMATSGVPADVRAGQEFQVGFRMAFACAKAEAPREASRFLELASNALDRMPGDTEVDRIQLGYMEAQCLAAADRHEHAIDVYRRTLAGYESHLGQDDARSLTVRSAMAISQRSLGDLETAVANHRMNVELSANDLGSDHPKMAVKHAELALSLIRSGSIDEAAGHLERAAAIAADVPDFPSAERLAELRGALALAEGRSGKALEHFDAALAIVTSAEVPRVVRQRRLLTERALAGLLDGSLERAMSDVELAFVLADSAGAAPSPRLRTIASQVHLSLGRFEDARTQLDAALAELESQRTRDEPLRQLISSARARAGQPASDGTLTMGPWSDALDGSTVYPVLRRVEREAWASTSGAAITADGSVTSPSH